MTTSEPTSQSDQQSNSKQLVELGVSKYEYIFNGIESIEAKSGMLLGFLGVMLTISFTSTKSVLGPVLILNVVAGLGFLLSGGCLLMALLVKPYRIDPDIFLFANKHLNLDATGFNKQLISNISDSVTKNLETLNQKSDWFNRALTSLVVGVGGLFLSHLEIAIKIFCKG